MIELSSLTNQGTKRMGKATEEGTKTFSDFKALLGTGKQEDEKKERQNDPALSMLLNQLFQTIPVGQSLPNQFFLSKINETGLIENRSTPLSFSFLQQMEKEWSVLQSGKQAEGESRATINQTFFSLFEKEGEGFPLAAPTAVHSKEVADPALSLLFEKGAASHEQINNSSAMVSFLSKEEGENVNRTELLDLTQVDGNASREATVGISSQQSMDPKVQVPFSLQKEEGSFPPAAPIAVHSNLLFEKGAASREQINNSSAMLSSLPKEEEQHVNQTELLDLPRTEGNASRGATVSMSSQQPTDPKVQVPFSLQKEEGSFPPAAPIAVRSNLLFEQGAASREQTNNSSAMLSALPQGEEQHVNQTELLDLPRMDWVTSDGAAVSMSSQQSMDPKAQVPSSIPVRADHLANDVVEFFQSNIRIHDAGDKMEATFSLTPEHLGSVDVKVSIHDGRVTAHFYADTKLGRDLLGLHIDSLQTALQQQGLQVDKIDISQQSSSSFTPSFSQGGDSNAKQGQHDSRRRNDRLLDKKQEEYEAASSPAGWISQINTTA